MGFLKKLGSFAGEIVGGVIGGGVEAVGTAVDSNFLKEVGQGVYTATVKSAETVGSLADGVVTTAYGVATDDDEKIKEGFGEVGSVIKTTANGVKQTIKHTVNNTAQVVNGVRNNDLEAAGRGARELAKTIAISSLAIGIADMLLFELGDETVVAGSEIVSDAEIAFLEDTFDRSGEPDISVAEILDDTAVDSLDDTVKLEPDEHFVKPHWVSGHEQADGTYVEGYWRDGDGDTSVNLNEEQGGGYWQSNPSV